VDIIGTVFLPFTQSAVSHSFRRGYIYGAVNGHREAMFTAAVYSPGDANLILTLQLTLTLILTLTLTLTLFPNNIP